MYCCPLFIIAVKVIFLMNNNMGACLISIIMRWFDKFGGDYSDNYMIEFRHAPQ
jgi:hypothetical protein